MVYGVRYLFLRIGEVLVVRILIEGTLLCGDNGCSSRKKGSLYFKYFSSKYRIDLNSFISNLVAGKAHGSSYHRNILISYHLWENYLLVSGDCIRFWEDVFRGPFFHFVPKFTWFVVFTKYYNLVTLLWVLVKSCLLKIWNFKITK